MKASLFKKNYGLVICFFCIFITIGCLKKEVVIAPQSSIQKKEKANPKYTLDVLRKKAEQAWDDGNTQEAYRLYEILVKEDTFSAVDKKEFLTRLIELTVREGQYAVAYKKILQWAAFDPMVMKQPVWQELWGAAVIGLPQNEAIEIAKTLWRNKSAPIPARGVACGILMLLSPKADKDSFAEALAQLYTQTNIHTRIMLEQRLLALLKKVPYRELVILESTTSSEKEYMYPWSIIILAMVHHEWKSKSDYGALLLSRINYTGIFADSSLLTSLSRLDYTEQNSLVQKNTFFYPGCYALALPMSGSYSSIGWKIAKGASIAQEELSKWGIPIEVLLINTEVLGWQEKLRNLPPECVVVGGPLRNDVYTEIKEQDLLSKKVFFAFLPSIDGHDEGVVAWRFFPSPEDQIYAILHFSQQIGITRYGVIYPEDSYGKKMANLFIKLAEQRGLSIVSINYDPTNTKEWNNVFTKLTGTKMVGKTPVPETSCQALFLPDSWKNIETLIPYLFFQGEDRLILAGTSLWEQGLIYNNKKSMIKNMELAIFPGGWDMFGNHTSAANLIEEFSLKEEGKPDFWVALGYDFIRFVSALNISCPKWTAKEINTKIMKAQNLSWSMAPISWDNGIAKQHLALFQPTTTGYTLIYIEKFKKRLHAIQLRHDKRVQAAEQEAARH